MFKCPRGEFVLLSSIELMTFCVKVHYILQYFLGSGKKGEAGGEAEEDGSQCCPARSQEC